MGEDRWAAIRTWLTEILHEDDHQTAQDGHTQGTGGWLFEDPIYQNWESETKSMILWLSGNGRQASSG